MRDYLNIGSTPPAEDCAQVGSDNYYEESKKECKRYIELLREKMGNEPVGARLAIKSFPHDFGNYYEVVCYYDDSNPKAVDYAFRCESEGPETWEG